MPSRASLAAFCCVAAAAPLLVSCAGASGGASAADWSRDHAVVEFSHEAVDPVTVRIAADGNVLWVNTEDDTRGFVVLPASMASGFGCALHPYFSKVGGVYRSLPITRTEPERVQLPCSLAKGTYDYEIWVVGSGFGGVFDANRPEQILRAKIVVE